LNNDAVFSGRPAWARLVPGMMFSPVLRNWFGSIQPGSEWLWHLMFRKPQQFQSQYRPARQKSECQSHPLAEAANFKQVEA
jgi:hypothetical protein